MAGDRARQVAIGLAAAATIALSAQEPPPNFRAEINYVQLPVRVLDANGQFVSGLRLADFQVLEDGKPQTITSFTLVDIPFVPPGSTTSSPSTPGSALSASDEEIPQIDGRAYLFVLDDLSANPDDTIKVRNLMHAFIRERLSANDMAAIRVVGGTRGQNFTLNHQLLHDAVDRFIGERDDGPTTRVSANRVVDTITTMVEWLGSIRGRRKALVWVSSSTVCSLNDEECREPLQHALRVTMQSDVSIHVIDPVGLGRVDRRSRAEHANPNSSYGANGYVEASSGAAARAAFGEFRTSVRGPLDGARYLAEESGGIALVNMIDLRPGLDRIVREMSSYYLLGYYSTNARTDGKFRRNRVAVAQKDVRVVHRNGYFAARGSK